MSVRTYGVDDLDAWTRRPRHVRTFTAAREAALLDDGSAKPTGQPRFLPIASADLASTVGRVGETRYLSDGPHPGARVGWATPMGGSAPAWCLWPFTGGPIAAASWWAEFG